MRMHLAALYLLALPLFAQNGAIQGAITDAVGAIVPRAPVEATNNQTGTVYKTIANNQGIYTIAGLPPGRYNVSIKWIAFKNFLRENLAVTPGETLKLDIRLADGETLNTPGELYFRHAAEEPVKGPAPRTSDGKPDFTGIWLPAEDPHPEQPELLPWAAELARKRAASMQPTPRALCLPTGIIRTTELDLMKFVQTPKLLVILVEGGDPGFRQIFLDGRAHPKDAFPTWQGHSVGRWEGDTLVVDTIGFNDKVWLSLTGMPQTEQMHIVEHLRRPNLGQMEIEYTLEDPGAFAKPWKIRRTLTLAPNEELQEYLCSENNKDPQHMPAAK